MNKKFTFNWVDCNAIVSFFGDISINDIMEANNIILGDRRFDKMSYQIFDYSHIKHIDLNDDIPVIISRLDNAATVWNDRVKVATVTASPILKKKIEEYNTEMNSSPWKTKTFDNIDDAILWCIAK